MGQEEVKKILEKAKGGWLLSREIAKKAKISLGSVQASLQRMIKWGEVESKKAREVIKDKTRITGNHPSLAYRLKERTDIRKLIRFRRTRTKKPKKPFKVIRK